MYKVITEFDEFDVTVEVGRYFYGDNIALKLFTENEGIRELFAIITVNLADYGILGQNKAFIDTNNCPWAEDFLKENGLGEPTGGYGTSGYCRYPLYNIFVNKIKGEE
jgi:hypothetical protein